MTVSVIFVNILPCCDRNRTAVKNHFVLYPDFVYIFDLWICHGVCCGSCGSHARLVISAGAR